MIYLGRALVASPWTLVCRALLCQALVGPLGHCGLLRSLLGGALVDPPGLLWARPLWAP